MQDGGGQDGRKRKLLWKLRGLAARGEERRGKRREESSFLNSTSLVTDCTGRQLVLHCTKMTSLFFAMGCWAAE